MLSVDIRKEEDASELLQISSSLAKVILDWILRETLTEQVVMRDFRPLQKIVGKFHK